MKKQLFEEYNTLKEKWFNKHHYMGKHNDWYIYYNIENNGEYTDHVIRRLQSDERKILNGKDIGEKYGDNFCTPAVLRDKITKFLDELDSTAPTPYNLKNKKELDIIKNKSNNNSNYEADYFLLLLLKDSDKKIPTHVIYDQNRKEVLISSVYGVGIKNDTITKDYQLQLKEQYEIINIYQKLF